MDTDIKTKFLKTSEFYLKNTECDAKILNMQGISDLALLEKKMSNRFFHHSKSVVLDKIS